MTLPIIPTLCTVISLIFASLTWISSKNRKQYNDPKVQDFFQRHRACGDKVYLYATSKLCNDQLTTDSTMSAEYVLLDKDEQVPNEKDRWKWMRRWLGDIDLRLYWSIMGICFLVCLIISIFIKPLQPLQSFQPTLTAISLMWAISLLCIFPLIHWFNNPKQNKQEQKVINSNNKKKQSVSHDPVNILIGAGIACTVAGFCSQIGTKLANSVWCSFIPIIKNIIDNIDDIKILQSVPYICFYICSLIIIVFNVGIMIAPVVKDFAGSILSFFSVKYKK